MAGSVVSPVVRPVTLLTGSPVVATSGLLDLYPGAAAAYSLERLAASTTNVVRVRRSSDDAEQDFTAAQVADGTLTTFCGVGDGFVSTSYDQSGNGNDATQATIAQQRKIVDSGTLVTEGGEPAIAGNIYGMELSSAVGLTGAFSILAVYNADELEVLLGSITNAPRIRLSLENIEVVNSANAEINITNTDNPPTRHTFNGSRIMFGLYRDTSNVVQATIAGQTAADDALTLSGTFHFSKLFARGNDVNPMDNKVQELIIWPYDIR